MFTHNKTIQSKLPLVIAKFKRIGLKIQELPLFGKFAEAATRGKTSEVATEAVLRNCKKGVLKEFANLTEKQLC